MEVKSTVEAETDGTKPCGGRTAMPPARLPRARRVRPLLAAGAAALVLVAGVLLLPAPANLAAHLAEARAFALAHETLAAAVFVIAYATLVGSFIMPACFVLSFASGALFGWLSGGLLSVAGATLGATVAFLLVSSTLGSALFPRLGKRGRTLCRSIREEGIACLVAMRLAPFLPFAAVTMAAGAARLRTVDFVVGTALGTTPAALIYASLGESAAASLVAGAVGDIEALVKPEQLALLVGLAAASLGLALYRRWARGSTTR